MQINQFFREKKNLTNSSSIPQKRSPTDNILVFHELLLEYSYYKTGPRGCQIKKLLFFCFLDLKKAYDTVPWKILFSKLFKYVIRGKTLRVIKNLFSSNPANVLIDQFLSRGFEINSGVLQVVNWVQSYLTYLLIILWSN